MLIAIVVLLNTKTSLFFKDSYNLNYWFQQMKISLVSKNDSGSGVPKYSCHLPLQWTLGMNFTNNSQPLEILHLKENDTCLEFLIKKHCYKPGLIIPNVIHYVMFGKKPLQFFSFLSYLSTWKNLKPCFMVIHGDYPSGPLFEKFLTYKPRIIHIMRTPKTKIFGKKIKFIQHKADVARLEIILKYGGIYFDYDQIALRSFDPLLNHSLVLGKESSTRVGNAVIAAEPSAMFLKIWMNTYHTYNSSKWADHSTLVPFKLSQLLSHLVFIVPTFFKPNYDQVSQIYIKNINWENFYAIHLYGKMRLKHDTIESIRYQDSTYGSVARYIYYGDKKLQKRNKKKNKR